MLNAIICNLINNVQFCLLILSRSVHKYIPTYIYSSESVYHICLSWFVYLYIYHDLCIYLSKNIYIFVSIYLSKNIYLSWPVYLSIYLSIYLSKTISLFVYLDLYLSIILPRFSYLPIYFLTLKLYLPIYSISL